MSTFQFPFFNAVPEGLHIHMPFGFWHAGVPSVLFCACNMYDSARRWRLCTTDANTDQMTPVAVAVPSSYALCNPTVISTSPQIEITFSRKRDASHWPYVPFRSLTLATGEDFSSLNSVYWPYPHLPIFLGSVDSQYLAMVPGWTCPTIFDLTTGKGTMLEIDWPHEVLRFLRIAPNVLNDHRFTFTIVRPLQRTDPMAPVVAWTHEQGKFSTGIIDFAARKVYTVLPKVDQSLTISKVHVLEDTLIAHAIFENKQETLITCGYELVPFELPYAFVDLKQMQWDDPLVQPSHDTIRTEHVYDPTHIAPRPVKLDFVTNSTLTPGITVAKMLHTGILGKVLHTVGVKRPCVGCQGRMRWIDNTVTRIRGLLRPAASVPTISLDKHDIGMGRLFDEAGK